MQEHHYGFLSIIWDLLKTTIVIKVVNLVATVQIFDLPKEIHEWLSCGIAAFALYHIFQKVRREHKENQYRKEKEVK